MMYIWTEDSGYARHGWENVRGWLKQEWNAFHLSDRHSARQVLSQRHSNLTGHDV